MSIDKKCVLTAIVLVAWAMPASGQTQSQYQDACQGDAMRLCGPYIPDQAKIQGCLVANKASLSPACRSVVSPAQKKKYHKQS